MIKTHVNIRFSADYTDIAVMPQVAAPSLFLDSNMLHSLWRTIIILRKSIISKYKMTSVPGGGRFSSATVGRYPHHVEHLPNPRDGRSRFRAPRFRF